MKKAITGLAAVLLALTTATAALAQTSPLWNDDDIIDSGSTDIAVDDVVPQEATVTLTGPAILGTDEQAVYTVEVTNDSTTRDLDSWVLGMSVDNIDDVDDVTITFAGSRHDLSNGTLGTTAELEGGVLYLRGSDDGTLPPGESVDFDFDVTFHKAGSFTGTAYVIATD